MLRRKNDYSVSFFDLNQKENYINNVVEFIPRNIIDDLPIGICDKIEYSDILEANKTGDYSIYTDTYAKFVGMDADVYHFPNPFEVPFNITSNSVVTVHDCIALMDNINFNPNSREAFKATINYLRENKDISIITGAQSIKTDIIQMCDINKERIFVIPDAYDKNLNYHEKNDDLLKKIGIDSSFLLYLGVLDFRKGIVNILNAFEEVKPYHKDLKLVLAGDLNPFVKDIPDRLANYKYIDDVILTGYVSNEEKRVLLSSAEIFLFPSEYEGFGIPVLEAMACGCPVITTNISSLPEVCGNAAYYVTPKDSAELSSGILNLLNDSGLREELIGNGFEQVKKYSWDRTAELTEEVYKLAYKK